MCSCHTGHSQYHTCARAHALTCKYAHASAGKSHSPPPPLSLAPLPFTISASASVHSLLISSRREGGEREGRRVPMFPASTRAHTHTHTLTSSSLLPSPSVRPSLPDFLSVSASASVSVRRARGKPELSRCKPMHRTPQRRCAAHSREAQSRAAPPKANRPATVRTSPCSRATQATHSNCRANQLKLFEVSIFLRA